LILVDTHVLVWLTAGDDRLGRGSRALLDDAMRSAALAVSAISFWEVAILISRGRLELDADPAGWRTEVLRLGIEEIPLTGEIAVAAVTLPRLHPDPADRIIAATALQAGVALMTADERLLRWRSTLQRHDARK
jgi:PIN domain nuclease of toxin-antitoxin system